jgi:hypothetical protein
MLVKNARAHFDSANLFVFMLATHSQLNPAPLLLLLFCLLATQRRDFKGIVAENFHTQTHTHDAVGMKIERSSLHFAVFILGMWCCCSLIIILNVKT